MTVHQLHRHRPEWTFGDRLRKVRRAARLTQAELAAQLEITPHSIDAWESDRNLPRDLVRTATRIEDQFGLVRGWMLGYADAPDGAPSPSGLATRQYHLADVIQMPVQRAA